MTLSDMTRSVLLRPVSLRQRSINASIWSIVDIAANNALRLVSNLILTRILAPDAFGAVAVVFTVQTGLVLITDISIHRSIVQSASGEDPHFLRVSWVVQAGRGAILTALVLVASLLVGLVAPLFAVPGTVYADADLPGLIALSSLTLLASGFESTNTRLAVRRMQLGRVAILGALTQIVTIVAVLLFTRLSATAWALVWGMVAAGVFRTILSHRMFDGPSMRFEWDRDVAKELWHFGKWLILSSFFTFLYSNADKLILGGFLKSEIFGYYIVAGTWVQAVAALIGKLTDPIAHSAFSEVRRSDPARTPRLYVQFRTINDLARTIIFVSMVALGPIVINVLYPQRYETAAAFVPLLALTVLVGRMDLLKMLVLSGWDSRTIMYTSLFQALSVLVCLPLGFLWFGTVGAVLASALSPLATAPVLLLRARSALNEKSLLVEIAAASLIVGVAVVVYLQYAGPLLKL